MEFIKISTVTKRKPFTREQRAAAVEQVQITPIAPSCNTALPYLCLPALGITLGKILSPSHPMGKRVMGVHSSSTYLSSLQKSKHRLVILVLTSLKLSNIIINFDTQGV